MHFGDSIRAKPSGKSLATITTEEFGEVDVEQVLNGLAQLQGLCESVLRTDYTSDFSPVDELDKQVQALYASANKRGNDPTVELGLHCQFKGTREKPRFNMHDHSTVVNWVMCSRSAEEFYHEHFKDSQDVRFVPTIEPGAPLSITVTKMMEDWGSAGINPKVLLMQQHGKFQSGDSLEELWDLDQMVENVIWQGAKNTLLQPPFGVKTYKHPSGHYLKKALEHTSSLYSEHGNQFGSIVPHCDDYVMKMLNSKKALDIIAQGAPNPDAQVYGGVAPLIIDGDPLRVVNYEDSVGRYQKRFTVDEKMNYDGAPYMPRIVLVPKVCAITVGKTQDEAQRAYEALLDTVYVMRGAEAFGGMIPNPHKLLVYTHRWKAEARRQAVSR